MNKIKAGDPLTQSADIVKQNIETLKALFPTTVREGKIDVEELKALLGEEIEAGDEYYRFTWAGKAMARREANKPTTATLRPNKADSTNWDTTQNIFIEGDNLEVLKLLQKSYANAVKMIYIDPPYNTGKDFVYKDNYADNMSNYFAVTGQTDEEGRKFGANTESDGRFHSNWLSMMYPRLKLAHTLLKDDGVIFISIDDNEALNLRKLMDEIFGEENFIADIAVVNNLKGRNDKRYIATANERMLMYVRTDLFDESGLKLPESRIDEFDQEDEIGKYRFLGLRKRGGADTRVLRPKMYFPFYVDVNNGTVALERKNKSDIEVLPKKSDETEGCWRWGKDTASLRLVSLIGKPVSGGLKWDVFEKDYLETDGEIRRIKPKSVFAGTNYSTDRATKEYRAIMPEVDFSNPKSVSLLMDLVEYSTLPNQSDIVLDFFAGSGTTAHAVMQLNADDGGNRRFICVQLDVDTEKDSDPYKAGFKKISDITKKRITRSGKNIQSEAKTNLFKGTNTVIDLGYRAYKLDTSNINAWDANPDNLEVSLFNAQNNIKEGRTEEDVLYEILLKYGMDLTLPIDSKTIAGKTAYNIGAGALFICLADGITTDVAEGIAKWKQELDPSSCKVIFKDTGFTDVAKTNSVQILKRYGITDVNTI